MTSSPPSSRLSPGSLSRVPSLTCWLLNMGVALVADLTQHLAARADNRTPPVTGCSEKKVPLQDGHAGCQGLVRFFALLQIKPHAPPLVGPRQFLWFHSCERTPQVEYLLRLLRRKLLRPRHPSIHRLQRRTTRVSNLFVTLSGTQRHCINPVNSSPKPPQIVLSNIYAFHPLH